MGRAEEGGRGRAGHLKRKFSKKRWGVGNKRETKRSAQMSETRMRSRGNAQD